MVKDTIISAFNSDGTLLKWLKKVEDALQNASASAFRVNKKGNATISFSIVFANGDTLESGDIILQQGESVTGATIRQGHLILTLSNGNELDAGDLGAVTGFSINDSQHLIVTYQNGTTQDLGAIFSGNVNVNGNFTANSIIENMNGYSYVAPSEVANCTYVPLFIGVVKNGNKLTFTIAGHITRTGDIANNQSLGAFNVPRDVGSKLVPSLIGQYYYLDARKISCAKAGWQITTIDAIAQKISVTALNMQLSTSGLNTLDLDTPYFFRYELTFLLCDNMVA